MISPYVGEVTVFAFNFAPAGWIACQGQLLPVTEYPELFSLIRTTFGGDGVETFGVPDFSSLTDEGGQYCMSLYGIMPNVTRDAIPGELALLPYDPPPAWINCDGQMLLIAQYQSLFKLLGTTFGGDGTTTFGIPDLKAVPPLLPRGSGPASIYSIANVSSGSTSDSIVAEVKLFPSACPLTNWSTCEGQLIPIGSNTALFSLLQTTYGGDGETNFALPDFSKLSPPGLQYFICTVGVYPSRPEATDI